jgi:hypothetical protein
LQLQAVIRGKLARNRTIRIREAMMLHRKLKALTQQLAFETAKTTVRDIVNRGIRHHVRMKLKVNLKTTGKH